MLACLRPMLQLPGAGAGRGPSIQIPGAGSAQPWALGADPPAWLQPRDSGVCSPCRRGML